jgi:hypothetical protein
LLEEKKGENEWEKCSERDLSSASWIISAFQLLDNYSIIVFGIDIFLRIRFIQARDS